MTQYLSRDARPEPINIVWRERRVFRLHYQCEACPNEWSDEALVVSHGYCPACDRRIEEPYYVEEFEVVRPEFDLGDE